MRQLICVDYSGVYELYRSDHEHMRDWPNEWGNYLDVESRYIPNPHVYRLAKRWRSTGAKVVLLTGGNSVDTSDGWPRKASPERVFDGVLYGDKRRKCTFDGIAGDYDLHVSGEGPLRCTLVDDSVANLAVANDAGWTTYYYDVALQHRRSDRQQGEALVRLSFQEDIAV